MKDHLPVLQIMDLKAKQGRNFVLDIPFLTISQAEILSLIGPNGCGKTTLLMVLAGLLRPSSGQILFKGQPVYSSIHPSGYRRHIAVVFQESLLLNTTVWENVAMGLRFRGVPKKLIAAKVEENLDRFHITHLGPRQAKSLSGGGSPAD